MENKELLLKDLCARLPYGVKAQCTNADGETVVEECSSIGVDREDDVFDFNMIEFSSVKPYLFPLSSMTEEQKSELLSTIKYCEINLKDEDAEYCAIIMDWYNKNHFDYRGLIEKGLAIDATGLNIY